MACDILIVEDEFLIALDIKQSVAITGCKNITIVPSGEEAVLFCQTTRPKMIFMDIGLKGEMNGIDAAHKINNNIPIIFTSGNTHLLTEKVIEKIKPHAIFDKPIAYNELINTVKKIME